MTMPIIVFTSVLAGLCAAAMLWFGADLAYKLRYTMQQRSRAKKAVAKEAAKDAKKKDKEK